MNALDMLKDLFAHMEWADATVWRAVLASPAASADATVRDKLFHEHHVQRAFLRTWNATAYEKLPSEGPALADVFALAREMHAGFAAHLPTIPAGSLDGPMVMPWSAYFAKSFGKEAVATTLGETLCQVTLHSTYHRGQVNMRLRELGTEPPLADYIAWLWLGRPRAEWPEVA